MWNINNGIRLGEIAKTHWTQKKFFEGTQERVKVAVLSAIIVSSQGLKAEDDIDPQNFDRLQDTSINRSSSIGESLGFKWTPEEPLNVPWLQVNVNNNRGSDKNLNSKYIIWDNNSQFEISTSYSSSNYKNITNSIKDDFLLSMSYRFLYSGAQMWTYIGITKWSTIEKFVISQWFALEWWKLKLSFAFLNKLTPFFYWEQEFQETINQKTIWVEYSKYFDKDSILNELKTEVVYYDVWDKYLWKVWEISENFKNYELHAAAIWWSKLIADVTAVWKLSEDFKLKTTLWVDIKKTNDSYWAVSETTTWMVAWVWLEYKISEDKKVSAEIYKSQNTSTASIKYTQAVGQWEVFIWVQHTQTDYGNDNVVWVWYKVNFWWKPQSKLPELFPNRNNWDKLKLSDLDPIPLVDTNKPVFHPKVVIYKVEKEQENKDIIAPTILELSFSTKEPTNQNVGVKVVLSEEWWEAPAWWTKTWVNSYEKSYLNNVNEDIIFTDISWNKVSQNISITNIDKENPILNWSNIYVLANSTWPWVLNFSENVSLSWLQLVSIWDNKPVWWNVEVISWDLVKISSSNWKVSITLQITTPNYSWNVKVIWIATDSVWNTINFESNPWLLKREVPPIMWDVPNQTVTQWNNFTLNIWSYTTQTNW